MNFANNIEIKCKERCNWSETVQMTWSARKRRIELVFLGPKLGYNNNATSSPYKKVLQNSNIISKSLN
jgi:hypothetical protein